MESGVSSFHKASWLCILKTCRVWLLICVCHYRFQHLLDRFMKIKPVILAVVAIIFLAGACAWPYVKMEFSHSAYYSQSDKREYEYYTPELLKMMPRISSSYTFQYISNHDSRAALRGIIFEETTDTSEVKEYLKSKGYEPQTTCDTSAECWQTTRSKDVVSLYSLSSPDCVVVQISENWTGILRGDRRKIVSGYWATEWF